MATKKKKPAAQFFQTVTDMRGLPADKIDHFCEDLRLWLHMHKQVAELQTQIGDEVKLKITTPTDAFGWIDDNKHDARIQIDLRTLESPQSADALDPSAGIQESRPRAREKETEAAARLPSPEEPAR